MVLPQNLSKSASPEVANPSGSSRPGNEKSRESAFDAVSQSEQKRLDARQASDAREAKDAENAGQDSKLPADEASGQKVAADDSAGDKTGDEKGTVPETRPEQIDNSVAMAEDESEIEGAPVTFAGLQALVASTPASSFVGAKISAAAVTGQGQGLSQGQPFVQGSMLSMAGLNGKPGSITLQPPGQSGNGSGMGLTEAMLAGVTGVSGEAGKASDSPILQNAIRFQGAMESVSAQSNAINTPKMAPDAPILRGYTTSIDVPFSHAEWGDKVAGKLTWLTARNMSVAEIHITPPDMGPMEVKVQVQQDQANISVQSANPVVREQLELHSQRLRDMLSEQGLSLQNFDVSDSGRDQTRDGESGSGQPTGDGLMADAEPEDSIGEPGSLDLTWKGEVDIFA
jgi:flagellar hook-length control protein FliK